MTLVFRGWVFRALIFAGFWTAIGLLFASQFYLSSSKADLGVSWGQAIQWSLADWYVFAALSLPALVLARAYPLEGRRLWGHLVVHGFGGVTFSLAYMMLRAGVGHFQGPVGLGAVPMAFGEALRTLMNKTFQFNLLVYWVIVGVSHALGYYQQAQERALRASELERSLVEAKLKALQSQLNPHFLFNALNAVATLMHRNVDEADRMLTRLGQLLRESLDRADDHEIRLEEDLAFLRNYLEIEQVRFGERLEVHWDIADEVRRVAVPSLVLQPLVENAIKHGVERVARKGVIWIRASLDRAAGRLVLVVEDNGPGVRAEGVGRERVGLGNTRARLRHLHGENQSLEIGVSELGGARVVVSLPVGAPGSVG